MRAALRSLVKSDSGVTALEYALILAIIAVVIVTAVYGVGDKLGQNFDTIAAAVSDQPVPGDDPGAPGDGERTTVSDPPRQATPPTPVADASALDDGGENAGGGPVVPTAEDGPENRFSGGKNIGQGTGAAQPSNTVAARAAEGASAGAGGTGLSASGGTGNAGRSRGGDTGNAGAGDSGAATPGTGRGGEPGQAGPGEASALLGRDSTSDVSWDATASWDQSAVLAPSAMAVPGGEIQSTGRAGRAGGESALNSMLLALLGLILGLVMVILGWKMALQAATKRDSDEQLEGWEPASFGERSDPRPV